MKAEPAILYLEKILGALRCFLCLLISTGFFWTAQGADSVCAKVRIEISQDVALERQAFEARMTISNNIPNSTLSNIEVQLVFRDESGNPVTFTTNSQNEEAQFFVRLPEIPGSISSGSSSNLTWLIIPSSGAGGSSAEGRLYFVGATLTYAALGRTEVVEIDPDFIFVKPQPNLRLDYFLPIETFGDDPLTSSVVEPTEPFHLGLRLRNEGSGVATAVGISSGQPRIVNNDRNLVVSFKITTAAVNDLVAPLKIQIPIGNILPGTAATAVWKMEASLYGRVTAFDANYSHADDLGGRVTSLFNSINTHVLLGMVRVDLAGHDNVRDFLAISKDESHNDQFAVFESNGLTTVLSPASVFTGLQTSGSGEWRTLAVPASASPEGDFVYLQAALPGNVPGGIRRAVRSDGKVLPEGNAWISKTRIVEGQYEQYVNVFDSLAPAALSYEVEFGADTSNQPPVFGPLRNMTVHPGTPVSFSVRASDPDGPLPIVTASGLPSGATFVSGSGSGSFSWTPSQAQAGSYVLSFLASDGLAQTAEAMLLKVGDGSKSLLDEWKERWFGAEVSDRTANSADFDGDGLSNLLEYALDLDPTSSTIESKPVIGRIKIAGKTYLTLTYVHRIEDPKLHLEVVASGDIKQNEDQWSIQTGEIEEPQDDLPPGMKRTTFRDSVALEDAGFRFLRLRVSLEP